jgi:hypothetical protein
MKLPTNQHVLHQLQNISEITNWEALFPSPPSGIYVMLYSLQVLDSLLEVNIDSTVTC